jgi:hypothetical protein
LGEMDRCSQPRQHVAKPERESQRAGGRLDGNSSNMETDIKIEDINSQ